MRKNNYDYKNQFLFRKCFFLSDGLGEWTRYEKLFFGRNYFFFCLGVKSLLVKLNQQSSQIMINFFILHLISSHSGV